MKSTLFESILRESDMQPGLTRDEYNEMMDDSSVQSTLAALDLDDRDFQKLSGPQAASILEKRFGHKGRVFYKMYTQERFYKDDPATWSYYFKDEGIPEIVSPNSTSTTSGIPRALIDSAERHHRNRSYASSGNRWAEDNWNATH
jgi:hypothetical protein